MEGLVEDPGYAALLGTFGPALLDSTGSRPGARQAEGMGGPAVIRHPRELRAIPNNAILQQLGWCANTLQGLGTALARHPARVRGTDGQQPTISPGDRVRAACPAPLEPRRAARRDRLPGPKELAGPGGARANPKERAAMIAISTALEEFGMWAGAASMLRRVQRDHLALRGVWEDAPRMATRELLLHALRLALVERVWLLATAIPEFSPRLGVTRAALVNRLFRLDVPATLDVLARVFPSEADPAANRDYHEPRGTRGTTAYRREHEELFRPMARLFDLIEKRAPPLRTRWAHPGSAVRCRLL